MKVFQGVEMLKIGDERSLYPALIWDEDSAILVDAALPGQAEELIEAIRTAGLEPHRIGTLLFTHQDIDHIGGAKEILEASRNTVTAAHEDEAPYIENRKTPVKLVSMEAALPTMDEEGKATYEKMRRGFASRSVPIGKLLRDGDVLNVAGGVEIIHTPGHTPGHICLYLRRAKALIAGDALNLAGNTLVGPNPNYTHDMQQALRSVKKLRQYDIESILCYHGGLFTGDVPAALDAIASAAT